MTAPSASGRSTAGSFARFLAAGATNTLGTLAIYLLFLTWIPAPAAWAVAFAAGVVFVNVVYPRLVFGVRGTAIGAAGNTAYYVVSFLVSEALLVAATRWLGLGAGIAGVLVAACMVPVNFLAARYICTRAAARPPGASDGS